MKKKGLYSQEYNPFFIRNGSAYCLSIMYSELEQ